MEAIPQTPSPTGDSPVTSPRTGCTSATHRALPTPVAPPTTAAPLPRLTAQLLPELPPDWKHYPAATMQEAAANILNSGHLRLLALLKDEPPFTDPWAERTIADILQEPGNEALLKFVQQLAQTGQADGLSQYTALRGFTPPKDATKELKEFVMRHIQRPPRTLCDGAGAPLATLSFVQGYAKDANRLLLERTVVRMPLEPQALFTPDKGFSSQFDEDKTRDRCYYPQHATNLGAMVMPNSEARRCIVTRSGRADNPSRLAEVVAYSCFEQLACGATGRGFRTLPDGTLEFRHAITSYLDLTVIKSDEEEYFHRVVAAVDTWPEEDYRVRMQVGDEAKTVILKKPYLSNQLLAAAQRLTMASGRGQSDYVNFFLNQRLFVDYAKTVPQVDRASLQRVSEALDRELVSLFGQSPDSYLGSDGLIDFGRVKLSRLDRTWDGYPKASRLFASDAYKQYQQAVGALLASQKRLEDQGATPQQKTDRRERATAMYALLFRRPLGDRAHGDLHTEPQPRDELHAADVEIYRNIVCDGLGLSKGKQCKSGVDRTGIGMGLAFAQQRFQDVYGKRYMPDEMLPNEERVFRQYYKEALEEFGVKVAIESKGYSGLKLYSSERASNPVLLKYLPRDEVEGLTAADLEARGRDQYKGKAKDLALFGQGGPLGKKVHEAQKKVAKADVGAVEVGVRTTLLGYGVRPHREPLLTPTCELAMSVADLHISKAQLQRLEEHCKSFKPSTLEERLTQYALKSITTIERRRRSIA